VNFPVGAAPEGSFAKPQDLIGRGLIVSMVKNEPFLNAKLASKEAGAGLPPVIPEGMRAVSVRVNEVIGVAGYVLPGTRIEQDQEKGKPMQVTVVTLLVYPEQSERLALASTEGKIQLALRNPLDQGAPETPGMKQGVLLGAVKAAPARQAASNSGHKATPGKPVTQEAPAAAPLPTVEIIRGDKRSAEVIK